MIKIKGPREIAAMRRAGRALAAVFVEAASQIKPGVTTAEIDRIIEKLIRRSGAKPAFKGYRGAAKSPFPASSCISIDEVVVHGIPSDRRLESGQIVGVDAGLVLDGWFADMAASFLVGEVDEERRRLWRVTREALYCGIARARPGNTLNEVGGAIQELVEGEGFSVVRDLVGHGIGSSLHEEPPVENFWWDGPRVVLKPGMTLAIEPMVAAGDWRIRFLDDGWTAVTMDRSPAGHFEHTVLITDGEPEILTCLESGEDPWRKLFPDGGLAGAG